MVSINPSRFRLLCAVIRNGDTSVNHGCMQIRIGVFLSTEEKTRFRQKEGEPKTLHRANPEPKRYTASRKDVVALPDERSSGITRASTVTHNPKSPISRLGHKPRNPRGAVDKHYAV